MHRHIGIYSGTFDPVHAGHIAFALAAKDLFHLDKVVFLPEQNPRRKQNITAITHRQRLLKDALLGYPELESVQLSTDQFTIQDTLPELHRLYPRSKFTLLIGSDVALHLPEWPNLPLLLADMPLLIAMRNGGSKTTLKQMFKKLEKSLDTPIRYTIIDSPIPHLASSQIRDNS